MWAFISGVYSFLELSSCKIPTDRRLGFYCDYPYCYFNNIGSDCAVDDSFSTEALLLMTRSLQCPTLRRRRLRAANDEQAKIYSRVISRSRTHVIRKTDSINKAISKMGN